MTTYDKFKKLDIDFSLIGLEQRKGDGRYFCTPKGAKIIGNEGVDGIHYCFVKGFDETVFSVNPSNPIGKQVHPIARSFEDFLRLITACGGTAAVEQAWMWNKSEFDSFLETYPPLPEQQEVFDVLREKLAIAPMEKPYEYIRGLQAGFDCEQIPYTKDYSRLLAESAVPEPPKEWKVFFGQPFCLDSGKGKPGSEIAVNTEFFWYGRTWHIPALYICGRGMVIDLCVEVEPSAIAAYEGKWKQKEGIHLTEEEAAQRNAEDPMAVNCNSRLTANGNEFYCQSASYAYYLPKGSSYQEQESAFITEHYGLDPQKGWIFMRCSFAMKNASKYELKDLSLSLEADPITVLTPRFTVKGKGDAIPFTNPVTGEAHILRVVEYEEKELRIKGKETYPTHYTEMSYIIEPDLPANLFDIRDCTGGDSVIKTACGSDFVGITTAIIGGADGPVVMTVAGRNNLNSRTVCSSLYHAPRKNIEWRMTFYKKEVEDTKINF